MSPGSRLAYESFDPSGLQSGVWSLKTGSNVSCVCPLPSASITNTWPVSSKRELVKTIFVPSGDQAGLPSNPGSVVSWVRSVPSVSIRQTSSFVPPGRRPAKTSCVPSGEKSGKVMRPPRFVTWRLSSPLAFIVQISMIPPRARMP